MRGPEGLLIGLAQELRQAQCEGNDVQRPMSVSPSHKG
jgi:hypothetical protein